MRIPKGQRILVCPHFEEQLGSKPVEGFVSSRKNAIVHVEFFSVNPPLEREGKSISYVAVCEQCFRSHPESPEQACTRIKLLLADMVMNPLEDA